MPGKSYLVRMKAPSGALGNDGRHWVGMETNESNRG